MGAELSSPSLTIWIFPTSTSSPTRVSVALPSRESNISNQIEKNEEKIHLENNLSPSSSIFWYLIPACHQCAGGHGGGGGRIWPQHWGETRRTSQSVSSLSWLEPQPCPWSIYISSSFLLSSPLTWLTRPSMPTSCHPRTLHLHHLPPSHLISRIEKKIIFTQQDINKI